MPARTVAASAVGEMRMGPRIKEVVGPSWHPSTDEFAAGLESKQCPRQTSSVNVKEVAMRSEAMRQLDVLVGSWKTTMRNAWFLEPADLEVAGSTTIEWLSDAFVV